MNLMGRVKYNEFESIGIVRPMEDLVAGGDLNEDMLIVEYGSGPNWRLFAGWWPYFSGHPKFGDLKGHFVITASRAADTFHHAAISWEARSLEELWSAVQLMDGWLADCAAPEEP